jgi:hypothetical protein
MSTGQPDHGQEARCCLRAAVSVGSDETVGSHRLGPRRDDDPARLLLAQAGTGHAVLAAAEALQQVAAELQALRAAVSVPPAGTPRRPWWRRIFG